MYVERERAIDVLPMEMTFIQMETTFIPDNSQRMNVRVFCPSPPKGIKREGETTVVYDRALNRDASRQLPKKNPKLNDF